MANRPVFIVYNDVVFTKNYDFQWYSGFAKSQVQKCINSLHDVYKKGNRGDIIEISRYSENPLGVKLSAFNLKTDLNGKQVYLESVYQGSKVFENGGPYTDLIDGLPIDAKRDERLKNSGKLLRFELDGKVYSNVPSDAFYNYIYIKALLENKELAEEILNYKAFTDIKYNPKKGIACQAKACCIYVSLVNGNKLDEAMESYDNFIKIVYKRSI